MYPLRMTRLLLVLLLVTINFTNLFAQSKPVTGKVTDAGGAPIESATVAIKGTKQSALTNERGEFSINVGSGDATLVVSFIGMTKQEIKIAGRSEVNISLAKDEKIMDDVVVIGYGTQRAREVTGSVATVDLKKIADIPAATVLESMRGQIPGVSISGGSTRPGSTPIVTVRQQFNFGKDGGNGFPLIIIDDIIQVDPQTGSPSLDRFNLLDMSEVESITVLRDGSAAIYGSRATLGAIVIKTKRGKIGAPRLSYTGKFETMDAISHGKVMNAKEYAVFSNRFNRTLNNPTADWYFTDKEIASLDTINHDWLGNDWRRSGTMQHSLDVSGGSDRATYFTGASFFTQGANLGSQDFKRWTFRAGTDVKVVNNMRLGATIAAANSSLEKSFTKININDAFATGGEQRDYSLLLHMPQYIPWEYTINGVKRYVSPALTPRSLGNVSGAGTLSNWNYYSLLNNGSKTNNEIFNYNANFSLNYDVPFIKGLSLKANYSIASTANDNEQVAMPMELSRSGNSNKLNYHLYTDSTTWDNPVLNRSGSRVSYTNSTGTSTQLNFFVNYDGTFGEHKIGAMVSGERGENKWKQQVLLYDNPIPGAYNGTSVSAGTLNTGNSITYRTESGVLSYLGRLNYSFRGKYLAQFVFRSDASTRFAPENRWGFFPGVSVGWIASDESWFKDKFAGVNYFKLRGSLAKTGNDNVRAWRWMQLYTAQTDKGMGFGSAGGNYTTGLTPDATPNRNVRWDQTIQRNLGIDFNVLRNRLTFAIDGYYNSTTNMFTDMTGEINVPITVGGAFAEQNYANINAWGTEISATWKSSGRDFNYSIGMNFGLGNNRITKHVEKAFDYPSTTTTRDEIGQSTISPAWGFRTWKQTSGGDGILRTAEDIDSYWNYLTNNAANSGIAGAAPKFYNITNKSNMRRGMLAFEDIAGPLDVKNKTIAGPDGTIATGQDFVKLKNKNRTYSIVTNLNASYKNISFMAQIATSWGGLNTIDVIKQATGSANAMWSQPIYLNNMYDSIDNQNGKYPNLGYFDNFNGANSDFWMISSFRCFVRSMSIGYTLPQVLVKKAHLENARVFLSGNNLWDFYNPYPQKYRNMYDSPTTDYPTLRTWALGINLGF